MKKIRSSSSSDRISFLPNEIQSQILSFLPLEDAIKTPILSSQWRHIHSSLPRLEFTQSQFPTKSDLGFTDLINHVLHAHDDSNIDKIWVSFNVNDEPTAVTHDQLNDWISIALYHHIQDLSIENLLIHPNTYTVPSSVLTCTSIKEIYLTSMQINFPTTTLCFPRLIDLRLTSCRLGNVNFSGSCCPVVQIMSITKCEFDTLSISSSTLRKLHIEGYTDRTKINLAIPSLTHFNYLVPDPPNITLETLSSLVFATFWVLNRDHSRDLVYKIMKGLHKVVVLKLYDFYVECLRINLLDYQAAAWSSLKYLTIIYLNERQVPVVKLILKSYPNLETLRLSYWDRKSLSADDSNSLMYWEEKQKETLANGYMFNNLREVVFNSFRGKDAEFEVMKYLVENATELKTMIISSPQHEEINEENMTNIAEKLKLYSQRRRSSFEYRVLYSVTAEPKIGRAGEDAFL